MEATYQSFAIPGSAGSSKPAAGEEGHQAIYQSFTSAATRQQAASLSKIVAWRAKSFLALLERVGQRRAAREMLLLARRYQFSQPEVAARLKEQALIWLAD